MQSLVTEEIEEDEVQARLAAVEPVIRSIVRHKLRVSLSRTDQREANLDALDVVGEIQLKLLGVLQRSGEDAIPSDFRGYAATVAYHSCADYLRARYPRRASLKNCLRRLLERAPAVGLWRSSSGEWICGRADQRGEDARDGAALRRFEQGEIAIPAFSWPRIAVEQWSTLEWLRLLEAVFSAADCAMTLDDLIGIVAPLAGWKDVSEEGEPPRRDEEEGAVAEVEFLRSHEPSPQAVLLSRDRLRLFWAAVGQLLPWHRAALLLNMRDGDIDSLPYYGVASVEEIGGSLELKASQLDRLEAAVGVDHDRERPEGERFAACWRFLPLEDEVIAFVLGVSRPQVIGYRSKARERLQRGLAGLR